MKLPINPAIACFAAALLVGGCASTMTAPSTPPAATVRIQEWTAAYYGSAAAGKGTLYYNGRGHHFTISGLGAGGMGAQKISATGEVYHLNNLSDFSGTYHGISRGLTLIEGKMHAKLTNGNGVVMYLAGQTEGLIKKIDKDTLTLTLDDGKAYKLNAETDIDSLKPGMDIVIAFDVTNGENVVTDMQLPDSDQN